MRIDFKIENTEDFIKIFTARPDTIFGATFICLSIDHPSSSVINNEKFKKFKKVYDQEQRKKLWQMQKN